MREITLTEARRRLTSIVREIRQDPAASYRIRVRDRVVAELRSPEPAQAQANAAEALLRLADKIARRRRSRKPGATSRNYKEFLYGKSGVLGPRSRH